MRLRIPTNDEIEVVARWGVVRLLLGIGELGIYTWKQLSRLSLHCACGLENIYQQSLIQPFNALIWNDQSVIAANEEMKLIEQSIELFDFNRFRSEPDTFPHIRIIAKSGMGKTTLARYILHLLGGKQCVITAKKKPQDWQGLKVYGSQFKWDECEAALAEVHQLMINNYALIEQELTPDMSNIAIDEWRSINNNVDGSEIIMKELLSLARDGKVRILAIATGEQVKTWGLEGESDLEECFTTIRMGEFAIEYARKIKASKAVLDWLEGQERPCMVGRQPAQVPDLRGYQFGAVESPIKPRFSELETAETLAPTVLQPAVTSGNEVPSTAEMHLYRAFRAFQGSESDFIKQVWGARDYKLGKAELEALKRKFA